MATKKFNELTTSTSFNNTDFIVGYANTSPGGERKWQYSVIRNEISQYLPLSGGTLTNNLNVSGDINSGGILSDSIGNSNNWNQAYDIGTAYSLASSTFLTSETDSQTLIFDEGTKDLSISNGNTVSLSALIGGTGTDTELRDLSAAWQDASTVVQSNSAQWDAAYGSAGADLAVRALTANWESTYTTFKDVSSTFITSETDSRTLSFNEGTKDLSISNGNTVSLSALVDIGGGGADTELRDLSATWQDASTVVQSNSAQWDAAYGSAGADLAVRALTANWESTYLTVNSLSSSWEESLEILPTVTNYLSTQNVLVSSVTITDSLSVVGGINLKLNGEPALYVGFDKVGINTEFPNHELTVVGNISATGSLYGDGSNLTGIVAGDTVATTLVRTNSANWNQAYDIGTAYSLVSSTFLTSETDSQTLNFNESTKDLSISNGNTISLSALVDLNATDTEVRTLTSTWQDTSTVVQSNSANWQTAYNQGTVFSSNSSSYVTNTTLDTVSSQLVLTSDFNNYKTDAAGTTATLLPTTTYQSTSGNWENTYTNYTTNSASFVKTTTTPAPGLSAVTTIVAVSAMPVSPDPNTLYIVI